MFRTLKNRLGERSNNTLPEFCYNDDDVDNGCAGGNFNGRDDVAKETDGVGGVVWSASLPSWCPSWMETNWRMALEGITTLSTWVETTGRITIKFFTALITFFLSCIVTWCFTFFHLLRRGRGYMNAIVFFGLLSECYVIWFKIDRIEICTVRCWTRAFAVVTWILSLMMDGHSSSLSHALQLPTACRDS